MVVVAEHFLEYLRKHCVVVVGLVRKSVGTILSVAPRRSASRKCAAHPKTENGNGSKNQVSHRNGPSSVGAEKRVGR
jgi:hypothetical protein